MMHRVKTLFVSCILIIVSASACAPAPTPAGIFDSALQSIGFSDQIYNALLPQVVSSLGDLTGITPQERTPQQITQLAALDAANTLLDNYGTQRTSYLNDINAGPAVNLANIGGVAQQQLDMLALINQVMPIAQQLGLSFP